MGYRVRWEWCISEVEWLKSESWGDTIEADYAERLSEFYDDDLESAFNQCYECPALEMGDNVAGVRLRLSLVRNQVDKNGVSVKFDEAYVENGSIANSLVGGYKMPSKMQRELTYFGARLAK